MRAVVVCLHVPAGLVGISVEGVQVSADLLDWLEVLDVPGAGFQYSILERDLIARNIGRC